MTGDGEGCQLYVVRIVCVLEREQVTKRVDSGPSAQQVPAAPRPLVQQQEGSAEPPGATRCCCTRTKAGLLEGGFFNHL